MADGEDSDEDEEDSDVEVLGMEDEDDANEVDMSFFDIHVEGESLRIFRIVGWVSTAREILCSVLGIVF